MQAATDVQPFPAGFRTEDIQTNGTTLYVRVGGQGPAVILKSPLLWHFRFGGPDMERLVAGRGRIYLDRFWNEFSADPKSFGEAAREHYA